jgi:DNA-binding MarR family transcriptional regulator
MRVRSASRALTRLYDDALRGTGLKSSQLGLLVAVAMHGEGGARIAAVADVLLMDRTTLARNMGPLEKAGLLRVARDPADARARIILLTPAGERAIATAYPLWEGVQRRVRGALGAARLEGLHEHVADLLAGIPAASPADDTR